MKAATILINYRKYGTNDIPWTQLRTRFLETVNQTDCERFTYVCNAHERRQD